MDVRTRPGTMLAETWLACRSKGQASGREGEGDAGAEGRWTQGSTTTENPRAFRSWLRRI